jgi:hypothetical protein
MPDAEREGFCQIWRLTARRSSHAAVFGAADTIYVALAIAGGPIVLSPPTLAILETNEAPTGERNLGVVLSMWQLDHIELAQDEWKGQG